MTVATLPYHPASSSRQPMPQPVLDTVPAPRPPEPEDLILFELDGRQEQSRVVRWHFRIDRKAGLWMVLALDGLMHRVRFDFDGSAGSLRRWLCDGCNLPEFGYCEHSKEDIRRTWHFGGNCPCRGQGGH